MEPINSVDYWSPSNALRIAEQNWIQTGKPAEAAILNATQDPRSIRLGQALLHVSGVLKTKSMESDPVVKSLERRRTETMISQLLSRSTKIWSR